MGKEEKTYEKALEELGELVEGIEDPNRALESISEDVKKAVNLIQECRKMLREKEENLDKLVNN